MKSFERKLNMKKNSYELLNGQNMNSSLKLILSFNFFFKNTCFEDLYKWTLLVYTYHIISI